MVLQAKNNGSRRPMQIRVLGHLEASVDDRPLALGGVKQRAVLAMLALEANRPVTADRIIEGLWGEQAPPSAAKMVQNYVLRLRKALAADGGTEIITRGRAYELGIDPELVDVCRFERLVAEAARTATEARPGNAAREALALFRGEPLGDVADEPFAIAEIRRLEELRLTAAELAIDADLAAGRHQEVVGEIDALLTENPLRERLHVQRMLALYRCGRQADALEAFHQARSTLIEEIGVEPGPDLRRVQEAILRQDPSLDVTPAAPELPRELDAAAAPPLVGRADELRRLRACWQRAAAARGSLVTLVGAYGMGKTRVVAEIAADTYREGATVLYAAGTGPLEAMLAAISRVGDPGLPTLLVLDDVDRAHPEAHVALRRVVPRLDAMPVLILATGQEAAALARLEPHVSIALDRLDADAVRIIAGFYAPAGREEHLPVEALLAGSRGVARQIHEEASEWARREATRRVETVAGRAAVGRSEARALESELAGSVVELQSARERADLVTGESADTGAVTVCPYKGLETFNTHDAEYFFGRERLVAELVARLAGSRLLAVVGPSGSGKSSVVRAGLMPALAGGVLPGSNNWVQELIRPGEHPLRELRRATRRLAREWRSVLVVDQFEELFTACPDEPQRAEFIAGLVHHATGEGEGEGNGSGLVVISVRADFLGRCAEYPELSRLLSGNDVLVGPMSREEMRRAIERPAQRVGLSVEPELVELLLSDVEGQPGALPLTSTALLELWHQRDHRRLRQVSYRRSGGVQGAVARLAEEAFLGLDPPRQAVARKLLLRLTDEDEGGALVRRRIGVAELHAERGVDVAAVVSRLTERRLLTISDGAIEVAHEALLREWPRLRGWLDEDVEGRRLHRQISAAARAWDADARDPGGLYRGARLASALDWAADHDPDLNATERAFLDDSRRVSGRAQRRLRTMLAGVAALLILAMIAGLLALDQSGRAREEATAAAAQRLGAQALVEKDLDRALLLARQGVLLDDSPQTRSSLLASLLRSPAAIGVVHGDGDRLGELDLSPDGRTLAFTDNGGTLSFIDTRTRRRAAQPVSVPGLGFDPEEAGLQFSADGSRIATGGELPQVLDARTHRVLARLDAFEGWWIRRLIFAPDGRTLVAALGPPPPGAGTTIQRFDARDGRRLGAERVLTRESESISLMATSDGRRVVTSSESAGTVIRDARTLRPLKRLPVGAHQAALARGDRTMLVGGTDGSVRFLDLVTGRIRTASGRHDGSLLRAAFTPDGRTAITAGADNRAIVWDVEQTAAGERLEGHNGRITGMAISGDGDTLYTAARDGKVLVWDLAGTRRLARPFTVAPVGVVDRGDARGAVAPGVAVPAALDDSVEFGGQVIHALSTDSRALAVGNRDGTISITDARTLQPLSRFRAIAGGAVGSMAFVPRSRLLLVGGDDGFLGLFDSRAGRLVTRLRGHRGRVLPPSFSTDGRLLATASGGTGGPGAILVWSMRSGRPHGRPRTPAGDGEVSLSPDGRTLVTTSPSGVEVFDVDTLRLRARLPDATTVLRARFSPDGGFVIGTSHEGWTRVWSTKTWKPVGHRLTGHSGAVISHSTSPDGRTLATGSTDGTIRLFDLRTQRQLGAPLPALPNRPVAPEFTPDGAYLLAITDTDHAYRWDLRASTWARHACAVAGRTLTRTEWADVLGDRDYAPACTSRPNR